MYMQIPHYLIIMFLSYYLVAHNSHRHHVSDDYFLPVIFYVTVTC